MCLRPATPGFIVTLAATILLIVVSFSVPFFKTVYFLKASLAVENISGNITFGTLGYCIQAAGNTTCSSAKVGYQIDSTQLNQLLGLNGEIQLPQLFVDWLTYPLVLHIVGLILAAIAAVFGLLAHVREMAMTCFSTCISGFAAGIVLLAFIFDLVIFFLARAKLNGVTGGSASIGSAVWLTLAAWLLLFFAGCAFGFGRCCVSRRPRMFGPKTAVPEPDNPYNEALRLDAVKADADRKARQKTEVGLPAFQELESAPLKPTTEVPKYLEEEDGDVPAVPYRDQSPASSRRNVQAGTYDGHPGTSASPPYGGKSTSPGYGARPEQSVSPPYGAQSGRTMSPPYGSSGYPPVAGGPTYPPQPPQRQPSDPYDAHVPQASYYSNQSQNDSRGYGAYREDNYGTSQPEGGFPAHAYDAAFLGHGPQPDAYGGRAVLSNEQYDSQQSYSQPTGGNEAQNPNDYVDPYSQPLNAAAQGREAPGSGQRPPNGLMPTTSDAASDYRSPYLPPPHEAYGYNNTAAPPLQAGYGAPVSPTRGGPRGPRTPSAGWREPSEGSGTGYGGYGGGNGY